jgi:hypothetical protein
MSAEVVKAKDTKTEGEPLVVPKLQRVLSGSEVPSDSPGVEDHSLQRYDEKSCRAEPPTPMDSAKKHVRSCAQLCAVRVPPL